MVSGLQPGGVLSSSSSLNSGSFFAEAGGAVLAQGAAVPTPGAAPGKRVGIGAPFEGGPRDVPVFEGGNLVGIPFPLCTCEAPALAQGAFVAGIPGAPDCPVQLAVGPGNEALGTGFVRCVGPESHGAFVPAISPAIWDGRVVDVGTEEGGFGAEVSLAPWNEGCEEGWEFVCVVAIGIGASGLCVQENRDPKGKCWTTGNLERTSALYIFIIPLFIFAQPAVTPDISKRIGECSQKGPRLTS